jgi:hypothetical protein
MKITSAFLAGCVVLLFSTITPAFAVPVKFEVNLAYQITNDFPTFDPANDTVEIRGSLYNNWQSGISLVRVGTTTVYTNTFDITEVSPGSRVEFKFHTYGFNDNWEYLQGYIYTNGGNRAFILSSSAQTLTPVYFNDVWGGNSLLAVQVDMKPQIVVSNFDPGVDTVEVRGSWDGFSSGVMLTNNPASATSNIYSQTFSIASPPPGGLGAYKFHYYGSHDIWESRESLGADNRFMLVSNTATVLPLVQFNNHGTNDLLFADTYVTFSVNMTNAAGTDSYVFDPDFDSLFINGNFLGWWSWGNPPPQYQMFRVGTSKVYTNTLLLPKGMPVALTYKYGIGEYYWGNPAADNEAPFKVNHVRYVRNTGSCVLPIDTFGNQLVEPVIGSLKIAPPSAGRANVTWSGHLGIHLQMSTNLASSVWTDLPVTEALSATNYPVGAGRTFFRLVKP